MKLRLYVLMAVASLCCLLFISCDSEIIVGDYDHQIHFETDSYHFNADGGEQPVYCSTVGGYLNYSIIEAPDWIEFRNGLYSNYDSFHSADYWEKNKYYLGNCFEMRCLPNKTGATRKAIILIQAQDYFAGYSNSEYKLDFQGTITITQDAD